MSIRIKEVDKKELLDNTLLYEHNIKDYEIVKNENGKPYIKDSDVFISYSTSNSVSAVVTSKYEVGVSIKHYFFDEEILENCFTEAEKELVLSSKEKEREFTKIYTKKIAYIKMIGDVSIPLKDVDSSTLKGWETNFTKDYVASALYKKN